MHINFARNESSFNTRFSKKNFLIPTIKGCESSTFFYNGIKDWNSLPESVKSCSKKYYFKTQVKKYLMDKFKSISVSDFVFY